MNNLWVWASIVLIGLWIISPVAYFAYTNNEIKKLQETVETYREGVTVITIPKMMGYEDNKFLVVGAVSLGNGILVPVIIDEKGYEPLLQSIRTQYVKAMMAEQANQT